MNKTEKICENCIHFFQSGMAVDMSEGMAGYCILIRKETKNNIKSVVYIKDTCLKFKNRNKITI